MKNSLVIAALLGTISAVELKSSWAIGLDGDDFLGEEIDMKGETFKFMQKDT